MKSLVFLCLLFLVGCDTLTRVDTSPVSTRPGDWITRLNDGAPLPVFLASPVAITRFNGGKPCNGLYVYATGAIYLNASLPLSRLLSCFAHELKHSRETRGELITDALYHSDTTFPILDGDLALPAPVLIER